MMLFAPDIANKLAYTTKEVVVVIVGGRTPTIMALIPDKDVSKLPQNKKMLDKLVDERMKELSNKQ